MWWMVLSTNPGLLWYVMDGVVDQSRTALICDGWCCRPIPDCADLWLTSNLGWRPGMRPLHSSVPGCHGDRLLSCHGNKSTLSSLPITCFPKAIPQCICYTSTRFTSHQNMDAYTTQSLFLTLGGGLLNSSTCLMHLNGRIDLLLHQNTVLIWLHLMMGYIYTCMVRKKRMRVSHH